MGREIMESLGLTATRTAAIPRSWPSMGCPTAGRAIGAETRSGQRKAVTATSFQPTTTTAASWSHYAALVAASRSHPGLELL